MDIPKYLDLGTALETEISKLYETIAELSGDPLIAARLKTLANEEINHANILRSGKTYHDGIPEVFSGITMDENDARQGLEEAKMFYAAIGHGKVPLLECLKKMLDLETRFEKIHMGASVTITDHSLKKLFVDLSKGDHSHILVLRGLIESFG